MSETWMSEQDLVDDLFPDYSSFHSVRQNRRGGGTSIFINNRFKSSRIASLSVNFEFIESVFVKISYANKNLIISSCYRPPNADFNLFLSFMDAHLSSINSSSISGMIVCGDWNLDMFKMGEDISCRSFYNHMNSFSLVPIISKPTRIAGNSCTLIDNIFVSNLSNFNSGILTLDISDHLPIFINYANIFQSRPRDPIKVKYRILNEYSLSNFYDGLSRVNFEDIVQKNSLDRAVQLLDQKILELYNFHCPIKSKMVSPKDDEKPWINSYLKTLLKQRQKLFLLSKQSIVEPSEYRFFRNFVNNKLKQFKVNFYKRAFDGVKSDIKKTWKILNKIIKPNKFVTKSVFKKIVVDNVIYTDSSEIAEMFNKFFSTIGDKIQNSMSEPCFQNIDATVNIPNHLNSFFFNPISSQDIGKIILNFKNKSSDISTYSVRTLKYISDVISPIISVLVNKSISSGQFPQFLKLACVIPLFKSGDLYNLNNFRGI